MSRRCCCCCGNGVCMPWRANTKKATACKHQEGEATHNGASGGCCTATQPRSAREPMRLAAIARLQRRGTSRRARISSVPSARVHGTRGTASALKMMLWRCAWCVNSRDAGTCGMHRQTAPAQRPQPSKSAVGSCGHTCGPQQITGETHSAPLSNPMSEEPPLRTSGQWSNTSAGRPAEQACEAPRRPASPSAFGQEGLLRTRRGYGLRGNWLHGEANSLATADAR